MTAITYTAKRSVIPVHIAGDVYQLECEMPALTPWENHVKKDNKSMGGQYETILKRIETGYDFKAGSIADADFSQWREFLHSVAGGEAFTFDAFGTIALADNQEAAVLEGRPAWFRVNRYLWDLSFRIRQL